MNQTSDRGHSPSDVTKAQIGVGLLSAMIDSDANENQNELVRSWNDGHLRLWQKRAGLAAEGIAKPRGKGDDMGHTVRIDSPEATYNLGGLAAALLGSALALGGAGLGAAWLLAANQPAGTVPAVVPTDTDTDTRSTLRPYKGPN